MRISIHADLHTVVWSRKYLQRYPNLTHRWHLDLVTAEPVLQNQFQLQLRQRLPLDKGFSERRVWLIALSNGHWSRKVLAKSA